MTHLRSYGQALANAEPRERLKWERKRPIMAPLMPFIDAILEPDRNAPLKQRRIGQRIVTEHPERKVSEVTIRQYMRAQTGAGMVGTCDLCAAELRAGAGSSSRLA